MREWFRRWRPYLILAPLTLVLGFGYNGYSTLTGNDDSASKPVDVAKGKTAEYQGVTMRLTSLSTKKPDSSGQSIGPEVPKGSVLVIAKFRGRIDEAKGKKLFCTSTIENGDGWEWDSSTLSPPTIPSTFASGCDGKRLGGASQNFKQIAPKPHTWYEFAYGYVVPRARAKELRPTISYYKEFPRYLRFGS